MEKPNDAFFMKKALDLAQEAYDRGEVPVGAILVCEGRIIAKAQNQTEMLNDATAHAEMLALTSACAHFQSKYLKDCTLYVTLEPCPMCAAALYWTQVPRIVFGAKDEKRGYSLFQPNLLHPTTSIESGLMAEESAYLLRQFFKERRSN
jgi:tRNA(adenine34) deaminase